MFKPVSVGDRTRYSYARIKEILPMPHLIDIQKKSYEWLIREGLNETLEKFSPITNPANDLELYFEDFKLGEPKRSIEECRDKAETYSAPMKVKIRLVCKNGEIKKTSVYMGDFPLMTDTGTFIINGAERIIVSQLVRSPGVYYGADIDASGKKLFNASIIPERGAWLEFETDINDIVYTRIDHQRKIPVTILFRALGLSSNEEILEFFGEHPAIIATLKKDTTQNKEEALIEIYKKLRPGDPPILENAIHLLENLFFDKKRYDLAEVGRYKVNQKLNWKNRLTSKIILADDLISEEGEILAHANERITEANIKAIEESGLYEHKGINSVNILHQNKKLKLMFTSGIGNKEHSILPEDIMVSFNRLLNLMDDFGTKDDIDHLSNRRIRCVGELLQNQFRIGLSRMEKAVKERMVIQDTDKIIQPQNLINIRPIVGAIKEFFNTSQLSQFMDQSNPLAELTHKRRLSALGPGGLSRERAGYEVRDVHNSHYGRMCPIESPEGPNIGLIGSLSNFAVINKYGFIETPYRKVDKINNRVTKDIVYMSADEEDKYIIAQANEPLDDNDCFLYERVTARAKDDVLSLSPSEVDLMDVSPKQVVSIATALIPFLENDDANRALMGANMQRQAVPLLTTQAPVIGTGMEYKAATDSGVCVLAKHAGEVVRVVSNEIRVKTENNEIDTYPLLKFRRSNQSTCINQRPIVFKGDKVVEGQVLADGPATDHGELALGRNVIVAYMPWEGYNYEDAILLNRDLIQNDIFTSIHIEEYSCEARDTKAGEEKITTEIPNISNEAIKNLDDNGIIRIGAEVQPGDILVGKVTPKGESEFMTEERLMRAIFGDKAREMRDTSLRVPHGEAGTIVSVKIFSRKNGDELPPGVNEQIRISIAQKRKISEGDKMAGRHGNKGVVSRIMAPEDMPFLPNGEPVHIVLNPLGVPSRMNIGQILENHLGWAARSLGMQIENEAQGLIKRLTNEDNLQQPSVKDKLIKYGYDVDKYGIPETVEIDKFGNQSIKAVQIAVPVFDGANEQDIAEALELADIDKTAKTTLYDGRTGEPFDNKVTVGLTYMLKLHHLVNDKIHARSTGPYSLVTQQPLGGRAQFGGQRFGEMEVWALEAYGAAHTLQEMLTIKSDDVVGRTKAYEAIIKGENIPSPGIPESFKVLIKELQSIALDIKILDENDDEISLIDETDFE